MRIFKKNLAKKMEKYMLQNLMSSALFGYNEENFSDYAKRQGLCYAFAEYSSLRFSVVNKALSCFFRYA